MKKIISILLSVLMIFAVMAPAVSAAEEKEVTIYLEGYGSGLYGKSGEQAFPVDLGLVEKLETMLGELLANLAIAELTGDYSAYSQGLYDLIAPGYADLMLDKNGESRKDDGTWYDGLGYDPLTKVDHSGGRFTDGYYRFNYDWRLSVEYNAELLEKFIGLVKAKTGASKVNLVGRCLGGNVISALLQNASEETINSIDKVVMYISSTLGVSFISALFSGKVVLDPDAVDNYVTYSLKDNDIIGNAIEGEMFEGLTTIINFINEVYVLGYGTDVVERIVDSVREDALARILRDSYASFPSFWSMVCPDDVEDAIAFIYNTPELQEEYAGMIEKIRSYHENVQLNAQDRMVELKEEGMEIMVISKYNYADFPLSEDAAQQSDGTASTYVTSFGATVAPFGSTLSEKYIKSMTKDELRYLSDDKMIDASTCVLPDTTWFIKNLYHSNFPASVDALIDVFFKNDGMTVDTFEEYPQYLKYDKETGELSAVTGLDEGDIIDKDSFYSRSTVFMKIIKMILDFFSKLLGGEIKLPFPSLTPKTTV
ncbi:MAG: hypothetical protein E7544_09655 [Ruminococcaceae bacterium]|nr:hypothetical protein [Oscillospiraceae bacterium]